MSGIYEAIVSRQEGKALEGSGRMEWPSYLGPCCLLCTAAATVLTVPGNVLCCSSHSFLLYILDGACVRCFVCE